MIHEDVLARLLKKALSNGGDFADVFVERRSSTAVQLEDSIIEKVTSGTVAGAGIRVIHSGRTAYAYTNDFSEAVLMDIAGTVSRAAAEGSREPMALIKSRPSKQADIKVDPASVPASFKIKLVKAADTAARKIDSRIRQVSVSCRDMRQNVLIASSDGTFCEDARVYVLGLVHAVASDAEVIQTGYETAGGLTGFELFEEHSIENMAEAAAKRAVMMLSAERAPGGRMPVVISSDAGGTMIHEAIGHGLEADLARAGLSVYSGKLGQQVASGLITVIDDATIAKARGSFCYDDEGIEAQKKVLVEKGVLKGYMHDRLTSSLDATRPTGNGRRESFHHRPIPRMTNTYIAPGDSLPQDVVKSVQHGLFVKKMGGGQVNTVNGDFVFEVQEGYLIQNGSISAPVRGATLVGNGPDVLMSIDMVASDLGFSIGTCGKDGQGVPVSDAMPTLRIPELVVGGEIKNRR
ncbi:MAG: TldD/PmbA family protein [Nitrospiraceae bacterium]|nr:TldD/PmbA family protein [Nitrospiraceae bacterium]